MQGSFTSKKVRYFTIEVDYCNQKYLSTKYPDKNLKCKSKDESLKLLESIQVFVPLMTQYFDQNEFSQSPIKSLINNDLFSILHPNISQT